ncbi:hypothetical protein BDY24DRAFT_236186 [Mrakia frigida]|uniref:uncharacterized protein n=1 Tax=Mrakia frigida TaxID=29902 RepID=UPI003FCBFF60
MASNFASTSTYIHSPPRPSASQSLRLQGTSSLSHQQPPPPPRFFSSSAPSDPSPPKRKKPTNTSLDTWIHRDEAIARCFGEDLQGIVHTRQAGSDRFSLKTFPCVKVELVGILVYCVMEEKKRVYVR